MAGRLAHYQKGCPESLPPRVYAETYATYIYIYAEPKLGTRRDLRRQFSRQRVRHPIFLQFLIKIKKETGPESAGASGLQFP